VIDDPDIFRARIELVNFRRDRHSIVGKSTVEEPGIQAVLGN
jgi:hypothetical protein